MIEFLPQKPSRYRGFDANWEGGLDLAIAKWKNESEYLFAKALSPEDMNLRDDEMFDTAISMETLEHIPSPLVLPYLKKIADHLDGFLFVTVPNEKGLLFLAKWIAKKLFGGDAEEYSLMELVHATLGKSHRVKRREHKGFDYESLLKEISTHFDVVSVSGHPFGFLPTWMCFGVGIVAKSKKTSGGADGQAKHLDRPINDC
jgi:hypothetical protein